MQLLFGIIYTLLFFSCVAAALFIVYHLFRYSPSRTGAIIGMTVFLSVFFVLLFTNAVLFFTLPLDSFLSIDFDMTSPGTFPR